MKDISVKRSKAVRVYTISRLNLGYAKHEEVAIYAVNQRISYERRVYESEIHLFTDYV